MSVCQLTYLVNVQFFKNSIFSILSIFKFTFKQNENLNKLMSKWTLM